MTEYKITFPDTKHIEAVNLEQEKKINSTLKNCANGILSKILVFTYTYKACSNSEITDLLTGYYLIPFDKANLNKYIKMLFAYGMIGAHTSFYAMTHNSDPLLKIIREKHEEFLKKIPSQFHKKFGNVNYYYVTEYGKSFIPWASEVIGFKSQEEK